ncbi:MAG: aspartate aminotransferase family protein [Chitinophagales bacterium]|nr:aspartate aminotransferase family protein [Chitinophagales bacterium]
MGDNRQLFLNRIAQTSGIPLLLEIEKAEGIFLYDFSGEKYLDLISGISVSNIGHRNLNVIKAINYQLEKYLHVMVYGEFVLSPQVQFAQMLTDHLPIDLNCVYFTNSGTEATEGALKLAKRLTNRAEVVSFRNSYHGSSQGALSVMGDEYWRNAFRPLIPGNRILHFNNEDDLLYISNETAAVILEPVQAEAGVIVPENDFLKKVRNRCNETGSIMILDECQTAFGRTGSLFCFEQYEFIPDIILLAKALGGGMPLGAFISSKEKMIALTDNPVLGHITTFGGHPVCCAAGKAAMEVLIEEKLIDSVQEKKILFQNNLQHPAIKSFRSAGLLISLEFENEMINQKIVQACIKKGVLTDWFLFAPQCMRIAPPLIISLEQITEICKIILSSIDEVLK